MGKYPILSKAPITEALIDIRIKVRDDLKLSNFLRYTILFLKEYPNRKERYQWEGSLGI